MVALFAPSLGKNELFSRHGWEDSFPPRFQISDFIDIYTLSLVSFPLRARTSSALHPHCKRTLPSGAFLYHTAKTGHKAMRSSIGATSHGVNR
jgi:hypothetical protein